MLSPRRATARQTREDDPATTTGIAIVGTGYVADLYLARLGEHPQLVLRGVHDRDRSRQAAFAAHHHVATYDTYDSLLADPDVRIVLNLTNPREHAAVSRRALEAGKHVYSEKPLATDWAEALALVETAEASGLMIVSAPSTMLGEAAQTAWKALRAGRVGRPLVAYAELDDGLVHKERHDTWRSASGAPWPAVDEFEVGCTLEHAGYYVTWLVAMFGPATAVTSFAAARVADKVPGRALHPADTPDLSVGCITFADGTVARVTCSIIAAHDHSLRIMGDAGTLSVAEAWDFGSEVRLTRWNRFTHRAERRPLLARLVGLRGRRLRLVRPVPFAADGPGGNRIDFVRGVAELAEALEAGRPCRLSSRFSLHVNEIVLTLQDPVGMGSPRRLQTTCEDVVPMPWAR